MNDPLDSIRAELEALSTEGLRRRMRPVDGPQAAEVVVDGRRALNFSSNNYLGLADHPALGAAAVAAPATHGFGAGASRLIAGSLAPHRALEQALAAWLRTEGALLFNSGYQANVGLVAALAGPEDAVFSDALNHASLIDGCRLSRAQIHVYPHRDVAALAQALGRSRARRKIVLSDTVFSMDGDSAPIGDLVRTARDAGALVVLDEAHAIGVLGPDGRGLAADLEGVVVMGTLGKAFGAFGAFVAGPRPVLDLLVHRARAFVFSTALPSVVPAAGLAALELVSGPEGRLRRSQLKERCQQLGSGLAELGLDPGPASHIQPIFVQSARPEEVMSLSDALLERGIFVQGIRPPTVPRGTPRLRLSLMSSHSPAQVDRLLSALGEVRDQLVPRSARDAKT